MRRCSLCEGRKTFAGMGGIREKCNKCDGKGFMPEKAKEEVQTIPVSDATCIVFDEPPHPDVFNMNLVKVKKKGKKDVGKKS